MMRLKHVDLSLAAIAVGALVSCTTEIEEEAHEPSVRPVKLLIVEAAGSSGIRKFPATVRAATSSTLAFQVPGLVQEITVIQAQSIADGELVARLDPREYENNVSSARAQFDNAEAEYQRAVRLAAQDAISTSILEQRQSQRDTATAQLDTAEKALSDSVLSAPYTGVIANVHVVRFQNVQPGEPIVTILGEDGVEAVINVPSSVIVQSQQSNVPNAFVVFDAAPADLITATFKEVALVADPVSQTYETTFSFRAPDNLVILPGMIATLVVEYDNTAASDSATVAVPLGAILAESGSQFVWVVDRTNMTVSKRRVTIRDGIGETLVVTDGLSSGETIAGAGASYLAEGMRVRPWTD